MFGLSSIELLFVAVLAIALIGPRDLPQIVRGAGAVYRRIRRTVEEVKGSFAQLEREIDIVEKQSPATPGWLDFVPQEIHELRASIEPHGDPEETAEKYRTVKTAIAKAQQDYRDSISGDVETPMPATDESR